MDEFDTPKVATGGLSAVVVAVVEVKPKEIVGEGFSTGALAVFVEEEATLGVDPKENAGFDPAAGASGA